MWQALPNLFWGGKPNFSSNLRNEFASTFEREKSKRNTLTLLAQRNPSMAFSSITDQGYVFRENT